jgi:hypothetical protein
MPPTMTTPSLLMPALGHALDEPDDGSLQIGQM